MIKDFNKFVKESVENKGKSVGGSQDLFPSAPKKQTINRGIPTMDFLRIGKHIQTKKIDGFIDSVQNENIFICDRITGEVKKYTLKEVLKQLTDKKDNLTAQPIKGFEGTPVWATKQKIYEGTEQKKTNPEEDKDPTDDLEYSDNEDKDELDDEEIDTEEVKESYGNEREREFDEQELEQEQELELGSEEIEDPDLGDEEEDEPGTNARVSMNNRIRYGTEDNPEGLPNRGTKREMPNESWLKVWENYHQKEIKLVTEDIEEEEYEPKIIRGTEDNPLPDKKKIKIESYE